MKIRRLVLNNFRNYIELSWHPHSNINVLSGDNAQGKTNLLEAIFFCTTGRSFRSDKNREMIGWPGEMSTAELVLERINTRPEISVILKKDEGVVFRVNGDKQNRNSIYSPCLSVSFTPGDLDFISGPPSSRRRWLDFELGPYEVKYRYNLNKLEKVLLQRNNLLRSGHRGKINEQAASWNEQLFLYGSEIFSFRLMLLKSIFPLVRDVFSVLTSGKEDISFKYLSSLPLEKGMKTEDLKETFRETVQKRFAEELERQQSLFGPHRDDILFLINGSDVKRFGSRGQQRSVVLSLKLALMKMFNREYGEYPVLLLDDVFLELDSQRQEGLEKLLGGEAQVFITSNRDLDSYFKGRASYYTVEGGKIKRR